jgi:DNA-directed RNA polymerase specialized sigma24 family protein
MAWSLEMNQSEAPRQMDPVLRPFLQTTDEAASERHLERLINERAEPIIRSTIRRKLHISLARAGGSHQSQQEQDAEDVRGQVVVQLLTRLYDAKTNPNGAVISNFNGYVAITTARACDAHVRQAYPQRWSLKNRLRYLLHHQPGLGVWESDDGESVCGFAAWRDQKKSPARAGRLQELRDHPQSFARAALPNENVQRMNLADLAAAVFDWVGSPMELDDLVHAIAELQGVKDQTPQTETSDEDDENRPSLDQLPDSESSPSEEFEWRENLRWLWEQTRRLSVDQRRAFLLNSEVILEFPFEDIASMSDIAAALGMSDEQLYALWNDLPIDDKRIAALFGINRGLVLKRRFDARQRLEKFLAERP